MTKRLIGFKKLDPEKDGFEDPAWLKIFQNFLFFLSATWLEYMPSWPLCSTRDKELGGKLPVFHWFVFANKFSRVIFFRCIQASQSKLSPWIAFVVCTLT